MSAKTTEKTELFPNCDDIELHPDLDVVYDLHLLKINVLAEAEKTKKWNDLLAKIKKFSMTPFYKRCCDELNIPVDQELYDSLQSKNQQIMDHYNSKLVEAENDEDKETQIRHIHTEIAHYLCVIGSEMKPTIDAINKVYQDPTCLNMIKTKLIFKMIRCALFHNCPAEALKYLNIAKDSFENKADWEVRNKIKTYFGVYYMWTKDLKSSCDNLNQVVTTYTSYELMSFPQFALYTILVSTVELDRQKLKSQVINGAEIQENSYEFDEIRMLPQLLFNCRYKEFFEILPKIEQFFFKDYLLHEHSLFLINELKVSAYKQLFRAFKTLTFEFLASTTGQSVEDIDNQLSEFITNKKLSCKIDRISNQVFTCSKDNVDSIYSDLLSKGEHVMNRVKQLLRYVY